MRVKANTDRTRGRTLGGREAVPSVEGMDLLVTCGDPASSQELLAQDLTIFRHDPDQAIGIRGMLAHQLREPAYLPFETLEPPQHPREIHGLPIAWTGLGPPLGARGPSGCSCLGYWYRPHASLT